MSKLEADVTSGEPVSPILRDEAAGEMPSDDAEVRFRAVYDASPIGIAVADGTGHNLTVNRAYLEIIGYSLEEVLTVPFTEYTHPDDVEPDLALLGEILDGRRDSYQLEKRYFRKDGRLVWVSLRVSVVRDDAGRPILRVAMVEDITARKEAEEQIRQLALYDTLTNLPNRTLLTDRLQQAVAAAERTSTPLAILLLDLDGFKEVNDTLGHQAGDRLLQAVGERFRSALRQSDTVARLGGDEFAMLLINSNAAGAARVADHLLEQLVEPFPIEGHAFYVSASIGIAIYPEHGEDASTLMRRADVAMYAAKRTGSGASLYEPHSDPHSTDRLTLIAGLRHAIDHGEMVLHYQPKIDLRTGDVEQVEALVRWHHPEQGTISPDRFIPLAEQTGLIKPLTRWVLGEALRQVAAWQAMRLHLSVAVNLSAWSLHDPTLVTSIADTLEDSGIHASRLGLEITESALMVDPARARTILTALHDMGITLSIDDFGTGYSSLAYLRKLPVDEIKIDRSFILDLLDDRDESFILVRSIVELGHNLGLHVVAEGIETQYTLDVLGVMGCDLAQGYLLARPMPAREVTRWLATWPGFPPIFETA